MMDRIPDAQIKSCIRRYGSGEKSCYARIVRILSPYIYNYPRIVFRSGPDQCGNFYEYVLLRLERILSRYRESEARFVTWFTVVLRRRYLNFLREHKTSEQPPFSLDCGEGARLYDVIAERKDYVRSNKEGYDRLIDGIVRNLNMKQRLFFHLYFIEDLRPEDVGFIAVTTGASVREVLEGIDGIRNSMVRKYAAHRDILDRLGGLYREIIEKSSDREDDVIVRLKKRRDTVMEEYRKIRLNPSYKSIALFLGIPLGTVSTSIARMKKNVRIVLQEMRHEEMSF